MMHDGTRTSGGTMPSDLQEKVDLLLDEFVAEVDAISKDRHLQRGIARSQLPCSIIAVMDRVTLFVVAQFRIEGKSSTYFYTPDASFEPRKVINSAMWEFGFEDPFLIQFPAELLDQGRVERKGALEKIASEHIDSEFLRFEGLLNLLRTRPIFGSSPIALGQGYVLVLSSSEVGSKLVADAVAKASESAGLVSSLAGDIREGKQAVRELWLSINESRVIIADLTGPDPGVMYALGIAHTIGMDTILIHPQGSRYLVDIPRTYSLEYNPDDSDSSKLQEEISEILKSIVQPIASF
jgi:hypothetical protein